MPETPPHRAIVLMRESARLYNQLFTKRFRELNLTAEEARTLAYLSSSESVSQRKLAELMHVQPIVLSRLVDRLESGGWVERRRSQADRRVNELHLTALGRQSSRKIRAINEGLASRLANDLDAEQLAALLKGLAVFRSALEEMR